VIFANNDMLCICVFNYCPILSNAQIHNMLDLGIECKTGLMCSIDRYRGC